MPDDGKGVIPSKLDNEQSFQAFVTSVRMTRLSLSVSDGAMLETNPIKERIKDLSARTEVLRGYL